MFHIERNNEALTEVSPARFMAEAAELSWAPGDYPATISTNLGNGEDLILTEVSPLGDRKYTQQFGCVTLEVFND